MTVMGNDLACTGARLTNCYRELLENFSVCTVKANIEWPTIYIFLGGSMNYI